jgi:hypothetical protein
MVVLPVDKRPFPGIHYFKGISPVFSGLTKSLFKLFEQVFIELFARIRVFKLDPDNMARIVAGAIGNQSAFKALGKLYFDFFNIFRISNRKSGIHDHPVFKLFNILVEHKAANLMGGFREGNPCNNKKEKRQDERQNFNHMHLFVLLGVHHQVINIRFLSVFQLLFCIRLLADRDLLLVV